MPWKTAPGGFLWMPMTEVVVKGELPEGSAGYPATVTSLVKNRTAHRCPI